MTKLIVRIVAALALTIGMAGVANAEPAAAGPVNHFCC